MTDDIVTRLRNGMWRNDCCDSPSCGGEWYTPLDDEDFIEAADEIERLRAVCQQFAESADFYEGENGVVRTLRMNEQKFVDACRVWGRLIPSEKEARRD